MAYANTIHFFFPLKTSLANRTKLKVFLERIFRKEGKVLESLNYVFCSDKELLRINRDYLGHDYYTDIITFDLSVTNRATTAEIYISVERVKENARQLGVSFKEELHRVIFHGVLHLCGYQDKTDSQRNKIRAMEDKCLEQYFN